MVLLLFVSTFVLFEKMRYSVSSICVLVVL
jgi:hypothetical protein